MVTPGSEKNSVAYHYYESSEEAKQVVKDARRELAGAIDIPTAIEEWSKHLGKAKVKPVTVDTSEYRLQLFFDQEDGPVASLSARRVQAMYDDLQGKVATQTHRHALAEAKRFLRWCVKRGYLRTSPAAKVEPEGKPNKGKPQLRVTEARRLVDVCLAAARRGDESAVAVLVALLLGLRASEVANLEARDIDDGGSLLWVADSKTEAGRRVLEVPAVLRPVLSSFAAEQKGRLFPERTRYWVYYHTERLCEESGVPPVCPHGLRGTHSTLATKAGATAELVMTALGHTSAEVARRHYLAPGAAESAKAERAAVRLLPVGNETP